MLLVYILSNYVYVEPLIYVLIYTFFLRQDIGSDRQLVFCIDCTYLFRKKKI